MFDLRKLLPPEEIAHLPPEQQEIALAIKAAVDEGIEKAIPTLLEGIGEALRQNGLASQFRSVTEKKPTNG